MFCDKTVGYWLVPALVDEMLLLFEFCDKTVGYWWQGSSVGELVSEWWAEGNWGGHASPSPCPLSYEGEKILHKYINIYFWGYAWCFLGFHECNLLRRQKLLGCEPHSMQDKSMCYISVLYLCVLLLQYCPNLGKKRKVDCETSGLSSSCKCNSPEEHKGHCNNAM